MNISKCEKDQKEVGNKKRDRESKRYRERSKKVNEKRKKGTNIQNGKKPKKE
jgi:hypothetical protein